MAMTTCRDCGHQISKQAEACPRCGAPRSSPNPVRKAASGAWTAIKVGVALLFGVIVYQCTAISQERTGSSTPRSAAAAAPPSATAPAPAAAVWRYETEVDPLTKKATKHAYVQSTNELSLDFPYRGPNRAGLWVRQSPRFGLDAFFTIEKGQLVCGYGDGGCSTRVAFDDGAPQTFSMNRAADGSSTVLFFQNKKRFIAAASKAKEIRVSANVYQAGAPVLIFRVESPLVWPPK